MVSASDHPQSYQHAFDGHREDAAAAGPIARRESPSSNFLDMIVGSAVIPDANDSVLGESERYMRGFGQSTATVDNALAWRKLSAHAFSYHAIT